MQDVRRLLRTGAIGSAVGLSALSLASVACAQPSGALAIQPMTQIRPDGSGYMADPQPVHLAAGARRVVLLSGTTKAVIACAYPLRPECFSWTPLRVDTGSLAPAIAGASVTNVQNVDLFQDDAGGWHAALTIGVRSAEHPKHWTVIAHAHPTSPPGPDGAPLSWSADTLLGGSFSRADAGNYDAKYYTEDGRLYMLYVRNTAPGPALRNAIMLQSMLSPTRAAAEPAVELLAPGDRYGPLDSETYANTQAKLVEAPYIARIGGKYALIYSTGGYLTPGYKAGVAWSDTLVPAGGRHYRKVLEPDAAGVWGRRGGWEVRYLLQSARPRWPDFTGGQVVGPGVASAVQGPEGRWRLFFNGFAPGDMPRGPEGRVEGDHRRPYFVDLAARVPPGASVATARDADLATWLVPAS